ncbi:MAG: T9SS type A sorting domain-containing protein [Bacteroidota bacterium]
MKKTYLVLLLLSHFIFNASAGSMHSVDVSYRHLGGLSYEVNMVFYRDCRAIPYSVPNFTIQNDSFSVTTTPTRTKIEDILYNCNTKNCSPSNNMIGTVGFEAHYLSDTIDFSTGVFKKFISKKYCRVEFAFYNCCRVSSSNLMNTGNLYVSAMLDLCMAQRHIISTSTFYNTIAPIVSNGQPFNYSFRVYPNSTSDSISYELVNPESDYKTQYAYYAPNSAQVPLTPYCVPANGKCNAIPGATPPRGTYFNQHNGNFIFTPYTPSEVSNLACKVSYFIKDSGKYKLAGFSKRDMQILSMANNTNNVLYNKANLQVFKIQARKKSCYDYIIKDDSVLFQKGQDTVKLKVLSPPKYGTINLVDSSAREKTIRYCWQPTDADYLSKNEDDYFISAYDRGCEYTSILSTTFTVNVLPPDSLTLIKIRTYYDRNKNGKKEADEPYQPVQVMCLNNVNNLGTYFNTDQNGEYQYNPFYGSHTFNINRSPYSYATGADITVLSKFDSTYTIDLGFNNHQGIKGKVFEDYNNNCQFDAGIDVPLKGIKVAGYTNNTMTFSDVNGEYLINSNTGSVAIKLDSLERYESACNAVYNTTIQQDSQKTNFDFAVRKKTTFKDIYIYQSPVYHNALSPNRIDQAIVIENRSVTTVKNIPVKLLSSRKFYKFKSSKSFTTYFDTVYWTIDSMVKNSSLTIQFNHCIYKDSISSTDEFKPGDKINYQTWASTSDNISSNNYFSITNTVRDTCCLSEKTVEMPSKYYPVNPTMVYKVYFRPQDLRYRGLVIDSLDDTKFNITSLKIIKVNTNTVVYVNNNKLMADVYQPSPLAPIELVYSIQLKATPTDSFTVYNTAGLISNKQAVQNSNMAGTQIASPITYADLDSTDYCSADFITLKIKSWYPPNKTNRFKVLLSDTFGQFTNPIQLLDTLSFATDNHLRFKLPLTLTKGNYSLKVVGTSPALEAFSSITLPQTTIYPLPVGTYSTNLNNNTICQYDTMRITAAGSNTYRFFKNNVPLTNYSQQSNYSEYMTNSAFYKIGYQSDKGCISFSPILGVSLLSKPTVTVRISDSTLCNNDIALATISGAQKYTLLKGAGIVVDTAITGTTYQWIPALGFNKYYMQGISSNGCKNESKQTGIWVYPLPAKPAITRVNRALKSSKAVGNQWYNTVGKIDSATSQFFYAPVDGTYYVKHTDSNGCAMNSDNYIVNYTSLYSLSDLNQFALYPNPANNQLTITTNYYNGFTYYLTDISGKRLLEGYSVDEKVNIALNNIIAGQYIITVITNQGLSHQRLIIAR